ncbi:hypothetical protein HN51_020824 [Arachis hypogaea]|uniref:Uncharacterized protein LOC107460318 isoform X1 n=1 Tax=Arachis duranensis TaxID=130453 RepID=A0A6P4B599_ARADU|nr:uncharacterized protein LOC107460318 isoform X1 [Arachis duranensis]XP_025616240.1 uncharacterized protein LOC112708269 [Arachis hypogaea]XP_052113355.1 uncharacterized protein LOC107460318 isoform X1 [Arachis duranensis]QHO52032.1 uncharacterized protein DS421_2g36080 [Arachis hypogaea]
MELRTLCCGLTSQPLQFSNHHRRLTSSQALRTRAPFGFRFADTSKCLKWVSKGPTYLELDRFQRPLLMHASDSNVNGGLEVRPNRNSSVAVTSYNGIEPFRGKPGSVSFYGITFQSVEEGKLESAPFEKEESSYFWLLAPVVLISSLILPQFFIGNVVETFFNDVILVDVMSSFFVEATFYIGLAIFLLVTDRVQRPYLEYSSKRWDLITSLRGYRYSAAFTMGLKIVVPLALLWMTSPVIPMATVVAITPFLVGCVAQIAFERFLDKRRTSCWPLVPIIFELFRLYQLTRAANFAERLMFSLKGLALTPEVLERTGALFAMMVTFQALAILCIWSLMTFLLRLFPSSSRNVLENNY